ncbi:unnamed protein product [Miscanthus lutarioriparius]|uniref:Uncharacterized protein n=1 Tax=Miscanthus lutarioriparius TaxID=422564 RepID=A0A811M5V8_9POAL|nr:unnamed protein product [Miscanthus lutarioriparius]
MALAKRKSAAAGGGRRGSCRGQVEGGRPRARQDEGLPGLAGYEEMTLMKCHRLTRAISLYFRSGYPSRAGIHISEPEQWKMPSTKKKPLVYFYGTKQIAFCNYADLEAFTEEKKDLYLFSDMEHSSHHRHEDDKANSGSVSTSDNVWLHSAGGTSNQPTLGLVTATECLILPAKVDSTCNSEASENGTSETELKSNGTSSLTHEHSNCTTPNKDEQLRAEYSEILPDSPNSKNEVSKSDGDEHLPLVKRARVPMERSQLEDSPVDEIDASNKKPELATTLDQCDRNVPSRENDSCEETLMDTKNGQWHTFSSLALKELNHRKIKDRSTSPDSMPMKELIAVAQARRFSRSTSFPDNFLNAKYIPETSINTPPKEGSHRQLSPSNRIIRPTSGNDNVHSRSPFDNIQLKKLVGHDEANAVTKVFQRFLSTLTRTKESGAEMYIPLSFRQFYLEFSMLLHLLETQHGRIEKQCLKV